MNDRAVPTWHLIAGFVLGCFVEAFAQQRSQSESLPIPDANTPGFVEGGDVGPDVDPLAQWREPAKVRVRFDELPIKHRNHYAGAISGESSEQAEV